MIFPSNLHRKHKSSCGAAGALIPRVERAESPLNAREDPTSLPCRDSGSKSAAVLAMILLRSWKHQIKELLNGYVAYYCLKFLRQKVRVGECVAFALPSYPNEYLGVRVDADFAAPFEEVYFWLSKLLGLVSLVHGDGRFECVCVLNIRMLYAVLYKRMVSALEWSRWSHLCTNESPLVREIIF